MVRIWNYLGYFSFNVSFILKDGATFAVCFICKEKGHLSSKCPQNPNGMYPKGGGCRVCGDKYHFAKDCPLKNKRKFQKNSDSKQNQFNKRDRPSSSYQKWKEEDEGTPSKEKITENPKNKVVKF